MGCSASRPNTTLCTKTTHHSPEDPFSSSSLKSLLSTDSSPSPSPVPRALSLPTPLIHHPPLWKGDTHHLVSLTSTTYGSLVLVDTKSPEMSTPHISGPQLNQSPSQKHSSVHADQGEPLSPDSVINTWELMDGLDDDCNFDPSKPDSLLSSKSNTLDCKTKDLSIKRHEDYKPTKPWLTKPLWKHLSEESLLSKLDPNVVSSYRRALSSRQFGSIISKGTNTISVGSSPSYSSLSESWFKVPSNENRIVLYFTSLRGIRKTYEDCCCVRMILRGFKVPVDERDVSMDSIYRKELQDLLGGNKMIHLPQVFIRGKHIGGVEEIKQLNESGELTELLDGFPLKDPKIVCEGCGDARFVPCPNCNGSRKVFEEDAARLTRCPDCNENGLIRCPGCCTY